MTIEVRRKCSTETLRFLWDAIVFIRQQRQVPNIERISNYLKRKHNISFDELGQQLEFAVEDGLISIKKSVACKGSKVGSEQKTYRIPENSIESDDHDWYCFGCHKEGEVLFCSTCHRVYHSDCLKEVPMEEDKFVCDICKLLKSKDSIKLDNEELNTLLAYAYIRLKDKVGNITELINMTPKEEQWRYQFLIYESMDLNTVDNKTENNVYNRIEEFQVDIQTIVHNVVLYFGVHSPIADTARQMLRDCCYDLNEIRQCSDCYKTSNEKKGKYWFCQPCNPAHELVYAKQKTYPFWPAKVIRVENGRYDVRFFGGYHERANIEKENIRPITTPLHQLQLLKRSATLNKALEELKRHQQLLSAAPKKEVTPHKNKKKAPDPPSANSSRSNSASRSRSRKGSVSSDEMSENEAEDNSSMDECPSSSSPKIARFKDAPTPEDHNVVSSSCQESSPCPKITVSTQTHKKLLASLLPPKPPKSEEKQVIPCDCEQKYSKMFKEFKERMEVEQKEEKERSLRELAERLRQDFDEEKQRYLAAAIEKLQLELGEAKRHSEEQLKSAHHGELTEILERHRMEVSEIKKKQWCYNCEAEAIYHCCWNTSYCSVDCQQVHWHKEHKRTCRRKR